MFRNSFTHTEFNSFTNTPFDDGSEDTAAFTTFDFAIDEVNVGAGDTKENGVSPAYDKGEFDASAVDTHTEFSGATVQHLNRRDIVDLST